MPNGVMQEIRDLLGSGRSSRDIITLGHAPSTVYKVQRQFRLTRSGDHLPHVELAQADPNATDSAHRIQKLEEEVRSLGETVDSLMDEAIDIERARAELAGMKTTVKELEADRDDAVGRAETLAEQVHEVSRRANAYESAASDASKLRQRVIELQAQIREASNRHAETRRSEAQLFQQCEAEQGARSKAEQQWRSWSVIARTREEENRVLKKTLTELEPLRVWAGHPCKVCKKPMSGFVSREAATELIQDFGHKACLKQDSNTGGALVLGLAAMYGLSRLRKGS